MNAVDRGQVNTTAAEVYEEFFLPALFAEWTERVADAAKIKPGDHVLDVACGTGILARTIAPRVGNTGQVTGLDINPGMLAVAERIAPAIDWRSGKAESLPFPDDYFDAVVSQYGLMFFEDKQAAIKEMVRVLKPGGRLAIAVWDTLDNTPGYAEMVKLLQRLFGPETAQGLRAPYSMGDKSMLRDLCKDAGIAEATITTQVGTARFASIEAWVHTDIKGWTLADAINDDQYALLQQEAQAALQKFVNEDGQVTFDAPAHIITYTRIHNKTHKMST